MKKLLAALFITPLLASAAGLAPSLTTTAVWESNVSNADRASDIIGAFQLRAELASTHRISLGRDDSLLIGGRLAAEASPRFTDLGRAEFGPTLAWAHKFGLGPFAPVVSVELAAGGVAARDSRRSGLAGSAALAWRQRLDESTRFSVTYERARHDARATLFDRTGEEGSLGVTRDLASDWSLNATVRYRRGDVLAFATPPRADLVALAKIRELNSAFGRPLIAYSLDAHTLGGALALNRTLGAATTLTLGYEYRGTTRQPVRYVNHLVSVALTRQF